MYQSFSLEGDILECMRRLTCFLTLLCTLPLAAQNATSTTPSEADKRVAAVMGLEHYREGRISIFMNDFGELARYRSANSVLGTPIPGERRVIFFGDSITDAWHLDQYFPGKEYINRGIGGQTTPQMLVRFREDVINLQPAVLVVLAGTNDIAGNTGPMTLDEIEENYASIAELARVHNIHVIFSSVLPVHNYTERSNNTFPTRSPSKILALNEWLKKYCATNKLIYLDYFSAMVDGQGFLRKELAEDGLHPNDAGYKIMAPLAQAAIDKALVTP